MKLARLTRVRWLLGTLLVAAVALFAIGVATEGDAHHETVASVEFGELGVAALITRVGPQTPNATPTFTLSGSTYDRPMQ